MATPVTLPASTLPTIKGQTVYLRRRWSDTWTADSRIWCEGADWNVAPTLPTAHLSFRYGVKFSSLAGDAGFVTRPLIDRLTYYVKVVYDVQPTVSQSDPQLVWYGVIDVTLDDLFSPTKSGDSWVENGRVHLIAYGMERLLEDCHMLTSYVSNGNGGALMVNRPLDFNAGGKPNRAEVGDSDNVPLFLGKPDQTPQDWNTRGIVRYLLKYHGPKSDVGDTLIPFQLDDSALLPNWDKPTLSTDGPSVRELLNSLISRQRLLGYKCEVEADTRVIVRPFTYTGSDITIEGVNGATIRANPVQISIDQWRERGAKVTHKRSIADRVDRVVFTGARRTSTGTFSKYQGSLDKGWKDELEAEYEAGPPPAGDGFPPSSEADMRVYFVEGYRAQDKFRSVYSRFVIPPSWDGKVGDGVSPVAGQILMPSDTGSVTPLAGEDWRFLRELPFKQNYDYTSSLSNPLKLGDGEHDFIPPIVLFKGQHEFAWGTVERYTHADANVSTHLPEFVAQELVITARIQVKREDGALWVMVEGGWQHMIAKSDFTPLPTDDFPAIPIDWKEMLVTASVAWSEYTTGFYPPATAETDAVRILSADLGEGFRCDYVAPSTVIALDPMGRPRRTDGGYVRDDRALLGALAQAAYEYYFPVRSQVSLETSWITSAIPLGAFLTELVDNSTGLPARTVNTVVTHIAIASPSIESEDATEPPLPKLFIETDHAELSALKLLGGLGPRP